MAVLHLLGTGAAYSDASRTTTMLAFESGGHVLVVDCGADVVQRLLASGLDPESVDAMIVTHEHADHVAGFPLFVERVWVAGRRRPIPVYGIAPAIAQARRCWEAFDTASWKDVPELQWHEIELRPNAPVLANERWTVTASPGVHPVPVVGVRVEAAEGGVVTYSCDTEPTDGIRELARGADILVHEAMHVKFKGHSTYAEAAGVAHDAGARRLVLVHLPPDPRDADLADARQLFPATELGKDGGRYEF
ncbi:MAG TPA: MBL fold metallo-hydrolase [Longimicrobium sp.]|nr:MBL fold metallo-hydrolase [Longimicrobium sp.]